MADKLGQQFALTLNNYRFFKYIQSRSLQLTYLWKLINVEFH